MKIFVVGATGVLGQRIVPALIEKGHSVTGMGRSTERLGAMTRLGMTPVVMDLFNANGVRDAVQGHDVVINVATKVPPVNRMFLPGAWKNMDHVRREGSAIVADAVIASGAQLLIQESFAREGLKRSL